MSTAAEVVEDRLLGGALIVRQPRRGHRAGTDAVLLASAASGSVVGRIADLGAGVGTVGLMMAARCPAAWITLVERNPALIALARENIARNGFGGRMEAVEADVLASAAVRRAAGLASESFDVVVTNPPWFEAGKVRASPEDGRRAAHVLAGGSLGGWLTSAADLLVPRGDLFVVHRAETLPDLIAALGGRFGAIAVTPVHPRANHAAIRMIVHARKGSRAPFRLEAALVLHAADGGFTPEADALHRLAK